MLVVVGSDNPVKIKATENVFQAWYGECEIVGQHVETGLPNQPLGLYETLEGAVMRARQAITILPNADLSVGIEAGLIGVSHENSHYFDQQLVAILDTDGWITIGGGPSFEHPKGVAEQVLKQRRTVGEVFEALSGISNIGRREGAVGYLSNGKISRLSITEVAVSMALIPRVRPKLYK